MTTNLAENNPKAIPAATIAIVLRRTRIFVPPRHITKAGASARGALLHDRRPGSF